MQDVLDNLKKAHEGLGALEAQARDRVNLAIAREYNADKREKACDERELSLAERESAVVKIENVVELKRQSDESMNTAQSLMDKLTEDKKQFESDSKIQMDKIRDERQLSRKEQENVDNQKKDMDKEITKRVEQCLLNMGIKKG